MIAEVETIDPALIAEYRRMATEGTNFRGLSVIQHARTIGKLIRKTGAKSLLDYGSGWGDAYQPPGVQKEWGVAAPVCYDPSIPGREVKPAQTFDGVICSDVLEHIPERHVPAVVAELFEFADKFVFASVCCRPAKKFFADQKTNLHVTVRPFAWWRAQMERAAGFHAGIAWHLIETH